MKSVAYQGEEGAFSHEAALRIAGPGGSCVPCPDFDSLFGLAESDGVSAAVVPVENTLVGSVVENLDRLSSSPLRAVAEELVRVEHCLIGAPGGTDEPLSVASHPVALAQCRGFLDANPRIRAVVAADTAGSVRALVEGTLNADAAIASRLAAERYGGLVLKAGIEDHPENYTRFLVLSLAPDSPPGPAKTSLTFTLPHEAGSLHGALGTLAEHGLDLSRIESRPIQGRPWEYQFHADLQESDSERLEAAVSALRARGVRVKVLGRYLSASRSTAATSG